MALAVCVSVGTLSLFLLCAFYMAPCCAPSFCDCGLFSHVLLLSLVPSSHALPDAVHLDLAGTLWMLTSKGEVLALQHLLRGRLLPLHRPVAPSGGRGCFLPALLFSGPKDKLASFALISSSVTEIRVAVAPCHACENEVE